MPYELTFSKRVPLRSRDEYINDCCIGGDAVVDYLMPVVSAAYDHIQSHQEDWGWFIWFRKGDVRLAIDVFTDDPDTGLFRIHLTSRKRRLVRSVVVDTDELHVLRGMVAAAIEGWTGQPPQIVQLDEKYM